MRNAGWAVVALVLVGCSSTTGTGPVDASAAQDSGQEQVEAVDAGASTKDASPVDAATTAIEATYFVVCLPPIVSGDTSRTFRFKAVTRWDSKTFDARLEPLASDVRTTDAPIGQRITAASALLDEHFALDYGATPDFPRESNGLTRAAWGMTGMKLSGTWVEPPQKLCTKLEGASRPSGLDMAGTTCIWQHDVPGRRHEIPLSSTFVCP